MRTNVPDAYTRGRSSEVELANAVSRIRNHVNRIPRGIAPLTTLGNSAAQVIWEDPDPLPFNSCVDLDVYVVGANAAGTAYVDVHAGALFFRGSSGAASQLGATQTVRSIVSGGVAVALGIDAASKMFVTVDDGGAVLDCRCWVEARPR